MSASADIARNVFDQLVSHALTLGLFETVNGHEPKSAPDPGGLSAAFWAERISMSLRSGLASTTALMVINCRVYGSMTAEPQDDIDPRMMYAAATLLGAYIGSFAFGGAVAGIQGIDVRGMNGVPLAAQAGYLSQDNRLYRVMVLTIPVIVNDMWDEAA